MDKNSNKYTFFFAAIMVVIVGVVLASAATFLKPMQMHNVKQEKMQDILRAMEIQVEAEEAEAAFNKYIRDQVVLNAQGNILKDTIDAFDISLEEERQKERRGEAEKRLYPMFIGTKDGQQYYIVPMRGQGLWGPIWGYMALQDDLNTIFGVNFDHQSETPGLGAEISTRPFENQFKGKKILDENNNFVSVEVVKGEASADDPHEVDGISGGTITSVGVSQMIDHTLSNYMDFIKNKKE